jgi:hypothetical protein
MIVVVATLQVPTLIATIPAALIILVTIEAIVGGV